MRRAMVSVMQALVSKRPELSSVFMEESWMAQSETRDAPLRALLLDSDERVRKDAVEAVVDLCAQNSDVVPTSMLQVTLWMTSCTASFSTCHDHQYLGVFSFFAVISM